MIPYYQVPLISQAVYQTPVIPQIQLQQNFPIQFQQPVQAFYYTTPYQQAIIQPQQMSIAPTFVPQINQSQPLQYLPQATQMPVNSCQYAPQARLNSLLLQNYHSRKMIVPNQNAFVTVVPSSPTKNEDQYKSPFVLQNSSQKQSKQNSDQKKEKKDKKKQKKDKKKQKKEKETCKLKQFLDENEAKEKMKLNQSEPSKIESKQVEQEQHSQKQEIDVDLLKDNERNKLPAAEFI